jgi:hypothetical protein
MAAAHHPAPALTHSPLSAFRPSDAELIDRYLFPKISGWQQPLPLHGGFIVINEADVYSKPPRQLVAEHAPAPGSGQGGVSGEWYFFTRLRYTGDNQMRCSRAVGGAAAGMVERWYSDRRGIQVDGTLYGYVKRLYHQEKEAEGTRWVRTGWAMEEFSYGAVDTVLCKVYYRPPRTRRAADQAAGTLAGEEVLLQEAANNLLNDDDGDDYDRIMANLRLQHGEDCDWDALFHSYLLRVGDGGAGDRRRP